MSEKNFEGGVDAGIAKKETKKQKRSMSDLTVWQDKNYRRERENCIVTQTLDLFDILAKHTSPPYFQQTTLKKEKPIIDACHKYDVCVSCFSET